jgi:hypothetical protein
VPQTDLSKLSNRLSTCVHFEDRGLTHPAEYVMAAMIICLNVLLTYQTVVPTA